jgi:NAD(P)-dependent dehydrogenase (short-subunit alcohol dehydrogenase family)
MASVYGSVPFDELTDEAWNLHLGVDLAGSFYCARAAVPHMRAQGAGHIVLFADTESASGRPLHRGFLSYFVAKSGVIALGRALALELARDRILVNTVALGPTLPADDTPREEIEAVAKGLPTGRWVEPGDVMRTVRHLIESTSMTGEVLRIDGGRHLV